MTNNPNNDQNNDQELKKPLIYKGFWGAVGGTWTDAQYSYIFESFKILLKLLDCQKFNIADRRRF